MPFIRKFTKKLQKLKIFCIKFIFQFKKYDHINDYYNTLNWLKLNKRREYQFWVVIYLKL